MNSSRVLRVLILSLTALSMAVVARGNCYDLEKRVKAYTLKNGIRVLMLERHTSPTVSLYIRQRVGAVDEPEGKTGMAHMLEHMMFKGTATIGTKDYAREKIILEMTSKAGNALDLEAKKGRNADKAKMQRLADDLAALRNEHRKLIISNEIDRIYTEYGGLDMNASTGQDMTTFHVSLPSDKVELWARIESDRMMNPVFREFYAERDVVLEERRQRVESRPDGKLMEAFYSLAFTRHPYRRPILGWPSDLPYIGIDDLYSFQKEASDPEKTVIVIVGDIRPDAAIRIVSKYFGEIPRRGRSPLKIDAEPEQTRERRQVELVLDSNPRIIMGFHKPNAPSREDYVFDLIETLMGKGRTSRLYKDLVLKKGIAESVSTSAGSPGSRYPNLFIVYATPRHPHTAAETEKAIYDEIEKIRTEPVSDQEMQKVKTRLKADLVRSLVTNSGIAASLSYYEALTGDYRYLSEYIAVIEKITPADILKVAGRYLKASNRTVVIFEKPARPGEKNG